MRGCLSRALNCGGKGDIREWTLVSYSLSARVSTDPSVHVCGMHMCVRVPLGV